MYQTIIGTAPNAIHLQRRGRDGINHTALLCRSRGIGAIFSDTRRQLIGLARQVRTDLLPIPPTVPRLPKVVPGKEKQVRIDRRKDHRLGADHSKIGGTQGHWKNPLGLAGASIVARQLATIDNIGIEWIGDDIAIFLGRDRVPITKGDRAIDAATGDSDRAALLLATV